MQTLTVEAKVAGRRRPALPEWSLPLPPGSEPATLRQLIGQVVRAEVAAFRERRAERRLVQVLTPEAISAGAALGRVAPGGRESEPDADPEAAVAAAVQAFEDGLYYVFIDDAQQEALDAPLALRENSRVTFLRLVALAGG